MASNLKLRGGQPLREELKEALSRRLATSVVERAIRTGVKQHGGVQFDLVTKHDCADSGLPPVQLTP